MTSCYGLCPQKNCEQSSHNNKTAMKHKTPHTKQTARFHIVPNTRKLTVEGEQACGKGRKVKGDRHIINNFCRFS